MSPIRASRHAAPPYRREAGFVLATGLLFLVILTLLALALFRGSGLMDRISGNTREKQRAFESAESALQYAEYWLSQGNGGIGAPCSGLVDATNTANIHTCTNALPSNFASSEWTTGYTYKPPNMTVAAGGGNLSGGDINYYKPPNFYVEYLGLSPDGLNQIYQVTAWGYAGRADTASVVQSQYKVMPALSAKPLDGL